MRVYCNRLLFLRIQQQFLMILDVHPCLFIVCRNIFCPEPKIALTTFNEDNNVDALFNVLFPETLHDEIQVKLLFNFVVVLDVFIFPDNNIELVDILLYNLI